jgi:glycosyltransferase involved in cell wall biosynthesis
VSRPAQLFVDTSAAPPFAFGPGIVNAQLRRVLEDIGYGVEWHTIERLPSPHGRLPLETVELIADQTRRSEHALRIFCTRPLDVIAPDRRMAGKNVVFFHGFGYNAATYLQNQDVDLWCANSAYVMRVLASFLYYPRDLAPFELVPLGPPLLGRVSLVAPCLEYPAGYPTLGADLSASWLKGHGRHAVLGHALRPGKAIPDVTLLILDAMNARGETLTPRRRFKLFVSEVDLGRFQRAANEIPLRTPFDDLIVPLPRLKNAALLQLMRRCAFSLCFDEGIEAFGLYPLESIMSGTPVYTNGAGNLRFLLPPGCGLQVLDDERLYQRGMRNRLRGCARLARAIVQDIETRAGARACANGRLFIERQYNYASFRHSWRQLLAGLASTRSVPRLTPGALRVQLGPLVRRWNPRTGAVISDYVSVRLPARENTLVRRVAGRSVLEVSRVRSRRDRETILDLFRLGVLSVVGDLPQLVRLDVAARRSRRA